MKRLFTISVVLLLVSCFALLSQNKLSIVHINDTHSNLTPGGSRDGNLKAYWGGVARAATMIGMTKMQNPNTIVLHGGDVFIGDLFFNKYFGAVEFGLMQALGFDAMTVGNHEWDLTPDALLGSIQMSGAQFPFLCANMVVLNPDYEILNDYIKPYTVKVIEGVRIGIFGMTTPEANLISMNLPNVFIDTNFVQIAADVVTKLKTEENCEMIIFLSHLGMYYDSFVAENIPGIDLIIGAHDHYVFETPHEFNNPYEKKVPYVQAGAQYKYLGIVEFDIEDGIRYEEYQLIKLDQNIPEATEVSDYIESLIPEIEEIWGPLYSQQIGYSPCTLSESVSTDVSELRTGVGMLVTKAFRAKTETEIAIHACGSTAQEIYQGPLVASDIYRAISYGFNTDNGLGFRIATLKVSGLGLYMGIEIGLAQMDINDEYLIQADGLQYFVDMSKPPFTRVTGVLVNGEPLDFEELYTVTTNEMIVMMMDYMGIEVIDLTIHEGVSEFEVVVDYIINNPNSLEEICNVFQTDVTMPSNKLQITLFPNPSYGTMNLFGEITAPGKYYIEIFDNLGSKVIRKEIGHLDKGLFNESIDFHYLQSGSYYLNLTNGIEAIQSKFIILK